MGRGGGVVRDASRDEVMSTACPVCGARVIQRVYVREGIAPLFVEVYACDAVKAFGLVTPGLPLVYPCEAPRKGIVAEPVSELASMITGAPMDIDAARAAEEKAYSDAYGFGEGVPESGGEPMRPGECQPRSKISEAWHGFVGESYLPGALVTPQPERYCAGFATGWLWRSHRWLDGHAPPAPFSNHGGAGWRWADMGMNKCACGGANRVRVGTIYLCAECRDILPGANGG